MTDPTLKPKPGKVVRVRQRQHLVEGVEPPTSTTGTTLVRLACLEDDVQGEPLEVLWETEPDAEVRSGANWDHLATRGFNPPKLFSAYRGVRDRNRRRHESEHVASGHSDLSFSSELTAVLGATNPAGFDRRRLCYGLGQNGRIP